MNRTQAARRIDEILSASTAVWEDGRCPHCEAILIPPRETLRPGEAGHHDVVHAEWCGFPDSVIRDGEELRRLTLRFGFRLASTMIEIRPGVGLLAPRRVLEDAGDGKA